MNLKPKDVNLMKLVLWACLVVWMVFFFAHSIVVAGILSALSPTVFGLSLWGQVMTWVLPIWYVFTVLMVIAFVARWVYRKFK